MEFILTESQLLMCIRESKQDSEFLSSSMKKMDSYMKNMVNRVFKTYELNLKMLLSWSTSIGGMIMPLDEYIKTGNFNLNENERYLVLAGVAFLLFFEGKRGMVRVLNKIKEEGLEEVFDATLLKGIQLKDSFVNFLRSARIVSSQFLEIISYTFLLPIIVDIQNLSNGSVDLKETALLITERLIASGLVLVSREVLYNVMRKLIKKLQ